jgi:hypothetical protein
MTEKLLRESVTESPVKKGNRWRVIVARPGKGSSGTYSEEMFRRDAHKVIAPGGQAFINHDDSRNPKDMIGIYPEGSFWSEEDKAVVSELDVFSHWSQFVEEVGPHCGISLYAMGEADDDGNVTQIIEDRLNGADLVARPGLVGSGLAEKLYESAKAHDSVEPSGTSPQEERKLEMEKDVEERFSALETLLTSLVAKEQTAQVEAAQAEADAEAVKEALASYDAAVKAIDAAELPAPVVESLRSQALRGVDVEPFIEQAKAIKDAVEADRISEGAQGRDFGARKYESAADLGKVFG